MRKNIYGIRTATAEPPSPPPSRSIPASTSLAGPPFTLYQRTHFMNDPTEKSNDDEVHITEFIQSFINWEP